MSPLRRERQPERQPELPGIPPPEPRRLIRLSIPATLYVRAEHEQRAMERELYIRLPLAGVLTRLLGEALDLRRDTRACSSAGSMVRRADRAAASLFEPSGEREHEHEAP